MSVKFAVSELATSSNRQGPRRESMRCWCPVPTLLLVRGWQEHTKPARLSHGHRGSREERRILQRSTRPMAALGPPCDACRTLDKYWLAARREDRPRLRCHPPEEWDQK